MEKSVRIFSNLSILFQNELACYITKNRLSVEAALLD